MEQFLSSNIRIFKGKDDLDKADEWIMEVEEMFSVLRTTEEDKVNFSSLKMKSNAKMW